MIFWSFCIKAKGHTTDANGNKLRKEVYTDELILNGTLQDKTYRANTIRSSAQAPANSTVTLEGRDSVVLGPGSEILAGSEFTTRIDPTLVPVDQTDYIGGIEYRNGGIQAIYHAEGRAVPDGTTWRHEYVITDHLGNARLRFSDLDGSGTIDNTELLSTHDYYPFGLEWDAGGYKYTFNGKEKNAELGLDWLDFGARWLDPVTGRWNAVDPLAEKYTPLNPYNYAVNNPVLYFDPDGKDAIITIDKENKSIQVSQTFHYSSENLSANLKGVPNADASAEITVEEFIMSIYNDFNAQWGSVESTEIDGEEFSVSFNLTLTAHDSNEQRDQAVADDKTSNKLKVLKSAGKAGSWASDTRTLTLGALEMRAGTMSHEIGHSFGLPGHQQGTGEITSYDESRTVQPREVTEALAPAIKLAQGAKGNQVRVHLTGHTTEAWRNYDPSKIINQK